jgi:hypothetical protein
VARTPHKLGANAVVAKAGDSVRFKLEMIKPPKHVLKLVRLSGGNIDYPIKVFVDGKLFVSNPPGTKGRYLLATRLTAIAMHDIEIEATGIKAGPCFVRIDGVSEDEN